MEDAPMTIDNRPNRISRREVLKWFATAAAASQLGSTGLLGQESGALPQGYGSDPKVAGIYKPGDFWPLTLDRGQHRLVTFLADLILPEDEYGPAASALRVPDFIDEWVSAPYPRQQSDRKKVLPGLALMNELSQKQHGKDFAELSARQGTTLFDDIVGKGSSSPKLKKANDFLGDFTSLCMGAYYGTPAGWKAIGYVGNTPMASFDGPPQAVLDLVGVVQTVK